MTGRTADAAGRSADEPVAAMREIVALWRAVRSRAFHGPGCSCCGAQPILIDAATLHEDIAYALRRRYRAAGRADLLAALDRADRIAGSDFTAWTASFAAPENGGASRVIYDDLIETLRSMTAPGGRRA